LDNSAKIGVEEFLAQSLHLPVVDVRSPAEHLSGCIPNSVNIPIFDNDQRASVGTLYKQKGSLEAIYKGLDFVGPAMSDTLRKGVKIAGEKKELLIHCWRGGMRSASMAWLFSLAGIKCYLLDGGYKQ